MVYISARRLTLAACGGSDTEVTATIDRTGVTIGDVYISTASSGSWGKPSTDKHKAKKESAPRALSFCFSVIKYAAGIGYFVVAVVIRNTVALADLADEKAAGLHRGIQLFREAAWRVRIGALLTALAGTSGHGQHVEPLPAELLGKAVEILVVLA